MTQRTSSGATAPREARSPGDDTPVDDGTTELPTSLHDRVTQSLGSRIVRGELPAGAVMQVAGLAREERVSVPVMREALRVLQAAGLIKMTRKVGIEVLPFRSWTLLDPRVIQWRLGSSGVGAQLRSLTELRAEIEPAAAALAASHAPSETALDLVTLAARMNVVGRESRLEEFADLDVRFHTTVLVSSGNELFAQMSAMIAEVLRGRMHVGLMPPTPHEDAMRLHREVAEAILERDAVAARTAMGRIMERNIAELSSVWAGTPRIIFSDQ